MPKFFVIEDNVITNLIVADSKEDAEILTKATCMEVVEPNRYSIGYVYNGEDWVPRQLEVENNNA